jgi:hypothetical protein
MRRLVTVRWQSPPPTAVDEELAGYDDGTVRLVVRCSRDGSDTVGTWSTTPPAGEHAAFVATGDVVVDLLHARAVPEVAERLRTAALAAPVATARFLAAGGAEGTVTLAAVGAGTRPVQFELDPDGVTVHVERDGATVAWFQAAEPATGFVTPDASGLGGVGRRAVIDPGAFGAIALEVPGMAAAGDGGEVAVQLSGRLAEGLPDQEQPLPFRVRTAPAPRT